MKAVPSILLACCLVFGITANGRATELRIQFQGPDRSTANIETAELLLIGWGWTDHVPLNPNGDSVVWISKNSKPNRRRSFGLRKTCSSLCARRIWPLFNPNAFPENAHSRFSWRTIPCRSQRCEPVHDCPDAPLETRRVRLLDDDAKPIAGLTVLAYRFESRENHCGFLQGPLLKEDSTDAEGRLTVPDGDFKYAFKLEYGSHVVFTSPERTSPLPDQNYFTAFLMRGKHFPIAPA
jgi:hypothetical protein